LGKAANPACPCGHPREDGNHITFTCPRFSLERRKLIGLAESWVELDAPRWIKEGDEEPHDQVEDFFTYLFTYF